MTSLLTQTQINDSQDIWTIDDLFDEHESHMKQNEPISVPQAIPKKPSISRRDIELRIQQRTSIPTRWIDHYTGCLIA